MLKNIPFFKDKINYTVIGFMGEQGLQHTLGLEVLKHKSYNLNLIANTSIAGLGISKNVLKHNSVGIYVAKEYQKMFDKTFPKIGVGISFKW